MATVDAAGAAESEPPYLLVFMLDDLFQLPGASAEMTRRVWQNLPVEILERVLLLVPAASQARFKSVCKDFRELLNSEEFRKKSARLAFSSNRHICGLVHCNAAGEVEGDNQVGMQRLEKLEVPYKVHKLSLDFLPKSMGPACSNLIYVAGGLMIFSGKWESEVVGEPSRRLKIYVVNVANRTWIELPAVRTTTTWERPSQAFSVRVQEEDGQLVQLKVILFHTDNTRPQLRGPIRSCTMFVYCSTTHSWSTSVTNQTEHDGPMLLSEVTDGSSRSCAFGKELIYAVPDDFLPMNIRPETRMWEFRSDTGQYVRNQPGPYRPEKCHFSVEVMQDDEGKEVVMAIPELRNKCEIWELSPSSKTGWKKLSSMPNELIARFRPPGVDVYATDAEMVGDVLIVDMDAATPDEPEALGEYGSVAYHVRNKTWDIVLRHRSLPAGNGFVAVATHAKQMNKIKHGVLCTWFIQPKPSLQLSNNGC